MHHASTTICASASLGMYAKSATCTSGSLAFALLLKMVIVSPPHEMNRSANLAARRHAVTLVVEFCDCKLDWVYRPAWPIRLDANRARISPTQVFVDDLSLSARVWRLAQKSGG